MLCRSRLVRNAVGIEVLVHEAVAALVGNTKVNLNGMEAGDYSSDYNSWGLVQESEGKPHTVDPTKKGCILTGTGHGRIFGCNNINGTPKGMATVHVFATQNVEATQIANAKKSEDTAKKTGIYDVEAVYGGGNLAAYEPTNAARTNTDDVKKSVYAYVVIDGCDHTSIRQVYGGGNAASTPATRVDINGTFEIEEAFGGGNGKDQITVNGVLKDNPGANVGFYDYSEKDAEPGGDGTYDTKAKRQVTEFINKYTYGSGEAQMNVHGGKVHRVYGGSNTKGNVRITAVTILEDASGCPLDVDEAYGGGKNADMIGGAKIVMGCTNSEDWVEEIYAGAKALCDVVEAEPIDMVLTAMVGFAGLDPTIHAIKARKKICLANKETLVVAGELVMGLAEQYHAPILPVDSEHSAIFQSLVGDHDNEIEKILLTASGGPFRKFTHEQMKTVTAADALKHPTWDMGAKITIDSASMMNKGFEVIEAKWLFGVDADRIQVLIHPQSIVHSAVQYRDGAVKAQLGVPDMRLPIQYAFTFPERLPMTGERLNLFAHPLEFFEPDMQKFQCLALAYEAIRRGGNAACVVNAANEVVNLAFRQGRCGFLDMGDIIAKTLDKATVIKTPTLEDYFASDKEARRIAESLINN